MAKPTKMTTARLGSHHVRWLRDEAEREGNAGLVETCDAALSVSGKVRDVGRARKVVVEDINRRSGYRSKARVRVQGVAKRSPNAAYGNLQMVASVIRRSPSGVLTFEDIRRQIGGSPADVRSMVEDAHRSGFVSVVGPDLYSLPGQSRVDIGSGKSKAQHELEIERLVGGGGGVPSIGYDRWAHELSDAAGRHNASIRFGSETHDAWRSGMSPDEYARGAPKAWHPGAGLAARKVAQRDADRDDREPGAYTTHSNWGEGHTRVDIRWYAIPNGNKVAGGFLPMISEDGRPRGDTWSGRGLDRAEAEAEAQALAHEAASRFSGDWNVTVKKGKA